MVQWTKSPPSSKLCSDPKPVNERPFHYLKIGTILELEPDTKIGAGAPESTKDLNCEA